MDKLFNNPELRAWMELPHHDHHHAAQNFNNCCDENREHHDGHHGPHGHRHGHPPHHMHQEQGQSGSAQDGGVCSAPPPPPSISWLGNIGTVLATTPPPAAPPPGYTSPSSDPVVRDHRHPEGTPPPASGNVVVHDHTSNDPAINTSLKIGPWPSLDTILTGTAQGNQASIDQYLKGNGYPGGYQEFITKALNNHTITQDQYSYLQNWGHGAYI